MTTSWTLLVTCCHATNLWWSCFKWMFDWWLWCKISTYLLEVDMIFTKKKQKLFNHSFHAESFSSKQSRWPLCNDGLKLGSVLWGKSSINRLRIASESMLRQSYRYKFIDKHESIYHDFYKAQWEPINLRQKISKPNTTLPTLKTSKDHTFWARC